MFRNLGPVEILLIILLLVVFFGAKKIPELAQGLGKGIKEFRKSMKEVSDDAEESSKQIPGKTDDKS
jgi:sec-independent protein translocase protein TatA